MLEVTGPQRVTSADLAMSHIASLLSGGVKQKLRALQTCDQGSSSSKDMSA